MIILNYILFKATQINRKQFFSALRKVLNSSDIILEVLDARDPPGTRCLILERTAVNRGKKVILILNKIGLNDFAENDFL
jgi:ribosome biogenesis GTPase A